MGDVVRAYAELIARGLDIADGSVFIVASGRPRSIASLLADLRRHARVAFEVRVAPEWMRAPEIPVATGDAAIADVLEHARARLDRTGP
ncbi:hypothetical protein MKK68_07100 [Methylobacterium sp. E-016]|uniref:hypothetical protein n=1 Tax=Methylobacterium sp. E-016 TaxID=2836556 RepID=UPI001FB8F26F|nr:hypothetical protein [Methylobacterium sp. E-016]MCJ2075424.1 hypothetical protein [Methylobacterium sp. E-016]